MSDQLLEQLSKTAGVDLLALKEKYANVAKTSASSNMSDEAKHAEDALSKYAICNACQGQGIVKSVYNHMVMEKTCELCDGESVILKQIVDTELVKSS